jgi:hypothetical protein
VFRPWGSYDSVDEGERFQVKRLMVKPGRDAVAADAPPPRRALDRRVGHRADHLQRQGVPARGERVDLHPARRDAPHREPGQDAAAHHRGAVGGYLGEDDIVRFEDRYGRAEGVYFATAAEQFDGGIMVTASHNPPDYNGMKFVREQVRSRSAPTAA